MQILGDLFPRDNFGDFFPTHSSLNSMSLESEQLQLSVYEIMGFTHTSSGEKTHKIKKVTLSQVLIRTYKHGIKLPL